MKISLDGVIFGIQNRGGISNYWARLVQYLNSIEGIEGCLLLPKFIKYQGSILPDHSNIDRVEEKISTIYSRYMKAS